MDPKTDSALESLYKSIQTFDELALGAVHRDNLYRYSDAFMQSLHSILEDSDCDNSEKLQYFNTTLQQYTEAMKNLFDNIIGQADLIDKSDDDRFDEIEEVEKFNPYHDSRGRFSSANSATSFTHRTKDPSKQHWADAAIAREKDLDDKGLNGPSSKNPLQNPDSLGGAERGEPMTRKHANSNHPNPNYFLEPGYRTNCQSCVVAFEARLRGYDVQTKPMKRGSMLDQLAHDTRLAWKDPKTGQKPEFIKDSTVTTPKKCRDWLEKTIQPGQRYTLQNSWKGRSRSGHIISADKDESGALRLYDPQSGKTYKGSDIDGYLGRCKYTATVLGTKINVSPKLTRVDNMIINTSVADHIMEAKVS